MINYLELAKEDIETALLLYSQKKYTNTLYHYHQSVEKTVKYVGLSIGGISEAQLNTDIKHDPIKVFSNLFKFFSENSGGLVPPVNPHLITNAKQMVNSWSDENLVNGAWSLLKTACDDQKIIDEKQFSSPFEALCNHIYKEAPELDLGLDDELFKKYAEVRLKKEATNMIMVINYGTKILQILFINSLICSKFKPDEFRYPSEKFGNPVEHFSEDNIIVKDLHFFINSMKISIEIASKINWKMKLN